MIDLGCKDNPRRLERIVHRKLNRHLEDAAAIRRVSRSEHDSIPVEDVCLIYRTGAAIERRILPKVRKLPYNSLS
jgi:hypothetical protein